jgi:hypothetical protein
MPTRDDDLTPHEAGSIKADVAREARLDRGEKRLVENE